MIRRIPALVLLSWSLSAGICLAGEMSITSKHRRIPVLQSGVAVPYLWLRGDEMLILAVSGPEQLGLLVRGWMPKDGEDAQVGLTVVRDDSEQGTVQFFLPAADGQQIAHPTGEYRLSGEMQVLVRIPEGQHTYRLLVFGPPGGALVHAFTGALRSSRPVVEATPGAVNAGPAVVQPPSGPAQNALQKRIRLLEPPPEDWLDPVAADPGIPDRPQFGRIRWIPPEPANWGPVSKAATSLAGALLIGAGSLVVAGLLQEKRAADESIQIPAGDLFDASRRSFSAAGILTGIAGAALATGLLAMGLEEQP